jgi:hypothetical protein
MLLNAANKSYNFNRETVQSHAVSDCDWSISFLAVPPAARICLNLHVRNRTSLHEIGVLRIRTQVQSERYCMILDVCVYMHPNRHHCQLTKRPTSILVGSAR